MATLSVQDIVDANLLMQASYSNTSAELNAALAGSGWDPIPQDNGQDIFYKDPWLSAPVTGFMAQNENTLAIAFQGSNELTDWITSDVGGGLISWAPLYSAYLDFLENLFSYLGTQKGIGIEKIIVTGHSLGAAMVEYFMKEMGSIDSR